MIAHLVMARGTARDNKTTRWSINAIEQYTGISRPRARLAVKELLDLGVWRRVVGGKHPVYETTSVPTLLSGNFDDDEIALIAHWAGCREGGEAPQVADATWRLHHMHVFDAKVEKKVLAKLARPGSIWMPNALVDGAGGEVPPLELLRQTRNKDALRLLIELYAEHYLPFYGGVPSHLVWGEYARALVGKHGEFDIWGFQRAQTKASVDFVRSYNGRSYYEDPVTNKDHQGRRFFAAFDELTNLGLIEEIAVLMDGRESDAEPIHPYGITGGEPEERQLGALAHQVATGMVRVEDRERFKASGYGHLVAVKRHIREACLVGAVRLRYRPHTAATGEWYAGMLDITRSWSTRYRELSPEAGRAAV